MKKLPARTRLGSPAALLILGAFLWGCFSPQPVDESTRDAGKSSKGTGSILVGVDATSGIGATSTTIGRAPTGDANCGAQISNTSHGVADVLLVFDRSASMNYSTATDSNCASGGTRPGPDAGANQGCTTRWSALTTGATATLNSTTGTINWGLKLFASPSGGTCGVADGVEVPIGQSSVPTIESRIAAVTPGNNTPTAQAILAATAYLKTVSDDNPKYILLSTDGEPNCAPGGNTTPNVQATIDAIAAAKDAGFLVYVIGIGPSVGNLDDFATAGGTSKYYPASSPEELTTAFTSIGKAVTTCSFTLTSPPPDPSNIAVYLDNNMVKKDDADGWSFSGTTVTLHGSTCASVSAGTAHAVRVLFGCPGQTPPPIL